MQVESERTKAPKLFHTRNETAQALCITERYLDKLCVAGVIPHVRLGRRVLFDLGRVKEAVLRAGGAGAECHPA